MSPTYRQTYGFFPLPSWEEELEKTITSNEDRGRTGLSPKLPLRTPTLLLTKNIHKIKNLQKHYKNRKLHKKNKTNKSQKQYKTYKPNKNSKTHKHTNKNINILSTNAAGLKFKTSDLKNKIRYLDSSIFSVQETHFSKKGHFQMQNYHIFEAIRKSKEKGGTMLGLHVNLNPVLNILNF